MSQLESCEINKLKLIFDYLCKPFPTNKSVGQNWLQFLFNIYINVPDHISKMF